MKNIKLKSLINEGTRSQVGLIHPNGTIQSTYVHFDGYPSNMKPGINKHLKNTKDVQNFIKGGGARGIYYDKEIEYYGDTKPITGDIKDVESYLNLADRDSGAEFVYLYNAKDKKWYFTQVKKGAKLKKL